MIKKIFIISATVLSMVSLTHGDVYSTREVLSSIYSNEILKQYDNMTESWVQESQNIDLERLLIAVEYTANKQGSDIEHSLRTAQILWNEAGIRSVDVLAAALLYPLLENTSEIKEEIETLFGSKVLYLLTELNKPIIDDMSLAGQLIALANLQVKLGSESPSNSTQENPIQEIKVYIKTLTGHTITINCLTTTLVLELKKMIQDVEGIASDHQRLIFSGKQLQDAYPLNHYPIHDGSTLHLVISYR